MAVKLEAHRIRTNGITLHVMAAGPQDGPLAILLHGFPEFWYDWRAQIPFLVAAGYRVLVPDQRGYNLSDKPRGIPAYQLDQLALDVVGLIDAAGRDKATVVSHDWGANVGWWLGMKHPQRIERLVTSSVPHPQVALHAFRHDLAQMYRSWYIFFFQLPWLPEALLPLGQWRALAHNMLANSRPGTYTPADMRRYRQVWSRPGAITAMLNWYRALLQTPATTPDPPRITVPTMLIWGVHDIFLGQELTGPSMELCDHGRLELVNAGHWVLREVPDQVNALLADFLQIAPAVAGEG